MRFRDFEGLVRRLEREVPPEFLDGVAEIAVSPKRLPHPTRGEIYTMGECIPMAAEGPGGAASVQSRVVLYHGSFAALAGLDADFDWRAETWETLTHELRHHLEWRAQAPDLEAFDSAAEQNFARHDAEPFDADFHLSAERVVDGVTRIDDDYFLDVPVGRPPAAVSFEWHGRRYRAELPAEATLPAFLVVEGVTDPPPGELVVVLRRKPGLRDLFRASAAPFQAGVTAVPDPA